MFKTELPMIKQEPKTLAQSPERKEQTLTSAQPASHITKVKPRPDFVVLGPGNGCRPAGTT